ncbi:MAG: hypothetical protein RLZ22_999, partial [Verrucomicrobiota bacterium]
SSCLPKCPRRESNPDLEFRKPSFYPLNYGGLLQSALPLPPPSYRRKPHVAALPMIASRNHVLKVARSRRDRIVRCMIKAPIGLEC